MKGGREGGRLAAAVACLVEEEVEKKKGTLWTNQVF